LLLPLSAVAADSTYAVIAGSVFRESGHAFPGLKVELAPLQPGKRFKKQSSVSTFRGEYSFRVPAQEMEYDLSVKADGYRPEVKRIKVTGEERIDHNFLMERLPAKP
jgi:hypothetical protein